jgi:GTP-binding nuclear protein Ran
MDNISTFKVCVIGDGGVGKTAFIKRHLTGEFERKYVATLGVELHPLYFHTNQGPIRFNMWDCAGQEKYGGLRDGYYVKADAFFVFASVDSNLSLNHVDFWIKEARRITPSVPIVLCFNKADVKEKKITPAHYNYFRNKYGLPMYEVSARSNYNFEKPFLHLAKVFLGQDTEFVEAPAVRPPVVTNRFLDSMRAKI